MAVKIQFDDVVRGFFPDENGNLELAQLTRLDPTVIGIEYEENNIIMTCTVKDQVVIQPGGGWGDRTYQLLKRRKRKENGTNRLQTTDYTEEDIRDQRKRLRTMEESRRKKYSWANFKQFCQENQGAGAFASEANFQSWVSSGGKQIFCLMFYH